MKILLFGAVWCGSCIVMKPRWEEVQRENEWLKLEYYDFDENEETAEKYKVDDVLPTAIAVNNDGEELDRLEGPVAKNKIIEFIESNSEK